MRGRTCVGLIELEGAALSDVALAVRDDLLAVANLLIPAYEAQFGFNLLETLQSPLDFAQSDADFYEELATVIAASSNMEFVALRELDGDRLRCIALSGFAEREARLWDIHPVSQFDPFARAVAGHTVVVNDVSHPELSSLRTLEWTRLVRSLVTVPIRAGRDTFGALTFGARCPYEFAPLELRGFEHIANATGVSIANFRNSRSLTGEVQGYTEVATAITGIEIARAARHEALGQIDSCNVALARLWRKVGAESPELQSEFDAVSNGLIRVGETLAKIKHATKVPDLAFKEVSVRQLWAEARTALVARLQEERINVIYRGPDASILASPDLLRQVFLNLLLNSIDAFREGKKRGRRIDCSVRVEAGEVRIIYADNATGINPQRLRGSDATGGHELPLHQLIFQAGVSSKRDGSGFGLYLVRRILAQHRGSIDLLEHRAGVTFLITLPTSSKADRSSGHAKQSLPARADA